MLFIIFWISLKLARRCGTWWHTRRNQISSFPETD